MVNNVVLVGRLTADIELKKYTRSTGEEASVCSFTVAVDRVGKDAGADFINCSAFGKTAEFVSKYFHKGDWIAVQGAISTSTKTLDDGTKRYFTSVNASKIDFCGAKRSDSGSSETISTYHNNKKSADVDNNDFDDGSQDLPF